MSKLQIIDSQSHCSVFCSETVDTLTTQHKAFYSGETLREGNYSGVVDGATHLWPRCLRKYPRTLRDCTRMPSLLEAMSL